MATVSVDDVTTSSQDFKNRGRRETQQTNFSFVYKH